MLIKLRCLLGLYLHECTGWFFRWDTIESPKTINLGKNIHHGIFSNTVLKFSLSAAIFKYGVQLKYSSSKQIPTFHIILGFRTNFKTILQLEFLKT